MKRLISLLAAIVLLLTACCAAAEEVWAPSEAPAVRNSMAEADRIAAQNAILEKGTLLFSGATNKGYFPSNISWLTGADRDDAIALLWACDDVTHRGWGVLGLNVNYKQEEIKAISDQPDKERLMLIPIRELITMGGGAASPDKVTKFSLGAWNGGRVAGLYFLEADAAAEMAAHLAQVEASNAIIYTYDGDLSNENAIPAARAVYAYLQETWGSACLTGQMESTWMGSPDYEMSFIEKHTGELPAIRGLDFMHNDFQGVVNRSIQWWEKGGIPHICWHTGSNFASGYNESKAHNLDWDKALTPGTSEYARLLKAMDRAVPYLQQLEDAGVPVLWRPFHELDGGWFWWSKGGSESFVKLWQLMYSRYTDYWGLDNLIWLLGYSGNGGNMAAWYPGDDYVDLIGADSYTAGANGRLYEEVVTIAPEACPSCSTSAAASPRRSR